MKLLEKVRTSTQKQAMKRFMKYLPTASNENMIRLTKLVERITPRAEDRETVQVVRKHFESNHPSVIYGKKILGTLHPNYRDKFAVNLLVNALLVGNAKRDEIWKKEGFPPPSTILISPTMKCNLRCLGCYAADYEKEGDLDFETVDRVINEAKELGTSFFTILGGEPFIWKDLFRMLEVHAGAYFQIYTNGSLIDKEKAGRLSELGNAAVHMSVEGFEEETDARRGKGVYKKIMRAMDYLREAGVLMGFSVDVTRNNVDTVTSDEFIDLMVEKGAYIGWYFLSMPVGKRPSTDFMPTPAQRDKLRRRRDYIRENKPLFIIDFWNDAPYVGGCIAARQYIHINSRGDVEPCIFAHFATHNIKKCSLREALKSPFFEAIRKRQPFNDNLFLPCMLIDNPEVFRQVHAQASPYPTHEGAEMMVADEKLKGELDRYSKGVKEIYEKVWEEDDKTLYPPLSRHKGLGSKSRAKH